MGPMIQVESEQVQKLLNSLVQAIQKYDGVRTLILFGSGAKNFHGVINDLDIMILVDGDTFDQEKLTYKLRQDTFNSLTLPLDILVEKKSVFDSRKHLPTLERVIDREGIILYAS